MTDTQKPTEGPWQARQFIGDGMDSTVYVESTVAGANDSRFIATFLGPDAIANARITATALDGLALARRVVEFFGEVESIGEHDLRAAARAVVAKAEGDTSRGPARGDRMMDEKDVLDRIEYPLTRGAQGGTLDGDHLLETLELAKAEIIRLRSQASSPVVAEGRAAYWTHEECEAAGHLYYFGIQKDLRARGPYTNQREVKAIVDIASDGTLAGVELIDDMPPPPSVTHGLHPRSVTQDAQPQAVGRRQLPRNRWSPMRPTVQARP